MEKVVRVNETRGRWWGRYVVRTVRVKKNATICKICVPLFYKKSLRTFMFCARNAGIWNCGTFCQTLRNSASAPHFHGLRHFTRRRTAVQPSKSSTFGGRKDAMFSCATATTFVAFFLTRIV